MNKDKKIDIQNKIIDSLQKENENLKLKIADLENKIGRDKETLEISAKHNDEYVKCINELNATKDKYNKIIKAIIDKNKENKKQFKKLVETIGG